jgi:hypothetical protein
MTKATTETLKIQYYISKIWINNMSLYKYWNLRNMIQIYQYKTYFLNPYTQMYKCKVQCGVQNVMLQYNYGK